MGDLEDGRYLIQLNAGRRLFVGAISGPLSVTAVVSAGPDRVWTVQKVDDGNYTLTLEGSETVRYSKYNGDVVVVDSEPPPNIWTIRRHEDTTYTIEVPSPIFPPRGWTLRSPEPMAPVTLGVFEFPTPAQLWVFVRVEE